MNSRTKGRDTNGKTNGKERGRLAENAIIKLGKGKGYAVRYELCTGCRACFLQCPCHAIEMVRTEVTS